MRFIHSTALVAALATATCSLTVNGPRQRVNVVSTPPGAQVRHNDVAIGTTPVEVRVDRGSPVHVVRVELDGFHAQEHRLGRSPSWSLLADIALGGFFWFTTVWALGGEEGANRWESAAAKAVGATPAILGFFTGSAFSFPSRVEAVLAPAMARDEPARVHGLRMGDPPASREPLSRWVVGAPPLDSLAGRGSRPGSLCEALGRNVVAGRSQPQNATTIGSCPP